MLALLIVAIVVTIAASGAAWSLLIAPALQGISVVVAIGGRVGDWPLRAGLFMLVCATVAGALVAENRIEHGVLALVDAAILAALPVVIALRLRRNLYVSFQTVLGAVSIYLVIGMVFAALDSAASALAGRSFFAGGGSVTAADYTYFSFITLATVGYGDFTPAAGIPRSMAVAEALLGQLYLVTIVALLVGNVGRARGQAT